MYRPFPLVLRYTACSGLINQHYSHIAGIALAAALRARAVVVPPGLARSSFAQYYSTSAEKNEVGDGDRGTGDGGGPVGPCRPSRQLADDDSPAAMLSAARLPQR